nr:hypothetical protein [Rickettsia rickettsii]
MKIREHKRILQNALI